MSIYRTFTPFDLINTSPFWQLLEPNINARDADHGDSRTNVTRRRPQMSANNPLALGNSAGANSHPALGAGVAGNDISLIGPRVDLHATDDGYVLSAELPGCAKDSVKLDVDERAHRLSLSGHLSSAYDYDSNADSKAPDTAEKPSARTLISERMYGSFSRSWCLPDSADMAKVSAKLTDGVLTVRVPFVAKHANKIAPRAVTIEDGGEE